MSKNFEKIFGDIIAFPTVSADSNLDMIDYIANYLDGFGAKIDLQKDVSGNKANIFATIGPDTSAGVVLSGHTDVVPVEDQTWAHDPFKLTQIGKKYYGRGTCDMKGFIASALSFAPLFSSLDLATPIHFALTYDEEVGCLGGQELTKWLRKQAFQPSIAIVGEPTNMKVVDGHKGCCEYTVKFDGLPGHSSMPERGVNAAKYAARFVTKLLELRELLKMRAPASSNFNPPWTTINVGRISGGTAHNVIVSRAEVDWEMRPVSSLDTDWVKATLTEFCERELLPEMRAVWPKASITTETIGEVLGLEPLTSNAARELVAQLTGQNETHLAAFGTEAGLFQDIDVQTVVCGPGSIDQAHKADEFVEIAQLKSCHRLIEKLAYSMAEG